MSGQQLVMSDQPSRVWSDICQVIANSGARNIEVRLGRLGALVVFFQSLIVTDIVYSVVKPRLSNGRWTFYAWSNEQMDIPHQNYLQHQQPIFTT